MRRGIGRLRAGGGGFSPISVFAGSAAGIWLDPSDITTGYVDSIATTPQTASGQQTGMRLDKRLGRNRVLTANFNDGSTAAWTAGNSAVLSVVSGRLRVTNGIALGAYATQSFTTVVGRAYVVGASFTPGTSTGVIRCGTTANGFDYFDGPVVGTSIPTGGRFVATGTTAFVTVINAGGTAGVFTDWDDIAIDEVSPNFVLQSTASTRPEYDVISSISSDFFDGIDDGYATAAYVAGTLTASMDLFVAIKRSSSVKGIVAFPTGSTTVFAAEFNSADPAGATQGCGSAKTHWVNGVQVAGGTASTAIALDAAIPVSQWAILEIRDLDLSTWTSFSVSLFSGYPLSGDVGGVILCPAQSSANRTSLRKWLGAKVGLSL